MDPISQELLDQAKASGLLGEGKADYEEAYGIGKWRDATLQDVIMQDATDFGYRLSLKFNLKGDSAPYTGRIDLPSTPEMNGDEGRNAWLNKINDAKKAVLNRLIAAAGYQGVVVSKNIDDEASYEAIVGLFRAKVGETMPIEVKADGKNQFVADPSGKATNNEGVKGRWEFVPNGFTKIDGLRRKK